MTKKLVFVIFIFIPLLGFSQSGIDLISEKTISEYRSISIFKALNFKDTLYLACRVKENEKRSERLALLKIIGDSIFSKTLFKLKEYVNYSDILTLNQGFLLVGSTFIEDEKAQDYLGYFNHTGQEIWNLKLEKKYEGIIKVFKSQNHLTVITNGIKGLFKYIISYDGDVINKSTIPAYNYIIDALETVEGKILVLSITLNENGASEKWNINFFSEDLIDKKYSSPDFENRFFPEKILEYHDGFLIAGNLDSKHSFIPIIYFLNHNLEVKNKSLYHYEPEHYKFKSSFQLKDIKIHKQNNSIIASGITKVVADETNIIFELNEDQILNYEILDNSSGIWMNNTIFFKSNGGLVFLGDTKSKDGFNTCIQKVDFEIKQLR